MNEVSLTWWPDLSGTRAELVRTSWHSFVDRLWELEAHPKHSAPLVKLAIFGDRRSERGSLRWDGNVLEITGVEGDYDEGKVSPEEARTALEQHNVRGVVVTTHSHRPEAPRWRLLLPTSRPYSPEERRRFAAWVNGMVGGILGPESFKLSQSFYVGPPSPLEREYKVLSTFDDPEEGFCLDELDPSELDALAIYPPSGNGGKPGPARSPQAQIREGARNETLCSFAGSMRARGMGEEAIQAALLAENRVKCQPPLPEDEVVRIGQSVARYRPGKRKEWGADECEGDGKLYTFVSDLEAESLPVPSWGIEEIYPQGGFVVLFGPRGVGKTFLALGWSFAHATGFPWLKREARRGPVVYIMAEGRGGLGMRVRAQKEHLGIKGEAGVHFITTAVPMLVDAEAGSLIRTIETLAEPPVAVVWDTLSRTFIGGDENSSKDMAMFVAAVDRVKEAVGGTAILQHHSGHASAERERGSSVLGGAADTILGLRKKDGVLELSCEKQKDAIPFSRFALELQTIGGSGVLVTPSESVGATGLVLTPNERTAVTSLQSAFLDDGATATAWADASELATSSFYRARTALVRKGLVRQSGKGRGARYVLTEKGHAGLSLQ